VTLQATSGRRSPKPRVLPRAVAFWLVAATTATLTAASSAPSPLYPVYQAEFRFSAITLTVIFAVYVFALMASLLTVGRLSDYIGRRVVFAAALVVEASAMALFLVADGVGWLLGARVAQGFATGAAIGVLGAYRRTSGGCSPPRPTSRNSPSRSPRVSPRWLRRARAADQGRLDLAG
jgi:MFS family permease